MREQIQAGLAALGLLDRVPAQAPEQLAEYGRLLLEKNQVMNLTAITDPDQVVKLHMLDCAALLTCASFADKRLIDVGTGAGFPGMVLKILVPSLDVVLLDSLNKRLDWLGGVAQALGLSGILTLHARAEEQALQTGWRDSFDLAASRAVAPLELLSELCLPYVKTGGQFLAMKAVDCEEELSRAREQAKANILMGLESTQARMSHMGRGELLYGRVLTPDEIIGGYDAVEREQIRALARELFDFHQVSLSAVGRVGSEEMYRAILEKGD